MNNLMNENFDEMKLQLDTITNGELLRIEIDENLEEAITELNSLKEQYSQRDSATLLQLCKDNVIETITSQFGLASLFINSQDGGNVTTTHNFENGITATKGDEQKYNSWREMKAKKWDDVRKETGYDKPLPKMRKEAFQTKEVIIDEYTGRPLPKDGRAQLDHIVSASEIENKSSANLFMTPEERAKMATNEKNLAWTEGSANQSKGKEKMSDWLGKVDKKTGETKAEKYGIDKEMAMAKDKEARKFVNKTVTIEATKKYTKEIDNVKEADTYFVIDCVSSHFVYVETTLASEDWYNDYDETDGEKLRVYVSIGEKVSNPAEFDAPEQASEGILAKLMSLITGIIDMFKNIISSFFGG